MQKIVIIGGGLGGLTAGALLAKDGYKVTLLEQHNIVGGCATTFKRKGGFTCEVGLHEMDGVYANPEIVEVFKKLNVYENVEFLKPDELFEIETKNSKFKMPDGLKEAKDALINKFPQEKKGINNYFKLIEKIALNMQKLQSASWYHYVLFPILFWNILAYKSKSTTEVLNALIQDEELKLILNANVQYYNDTPDTLSFLLHAVAQYSYYNGGGYFIKGGSGRLSDYLANVITENGGEIITKAEVNSCSNNFEVRYTRKKEQFTIKADKVISNLSPQDSYRLFNYPYKESKELGNSLLTIYLGFSKNIKETYGKRAYSTFIFDEIASIDEYNKMLQRDITQRGFVFVDYSQIDSNLTKDEHKSFGTICMIDSIKHWAELNEDEYKAKKEELIKSSLKKLESYYPNISNLVEYAEVGTAKTVKRYIKTPNGTAYGFKPTPKQFFKIPQTKSKIKNLYFVGQWIIAGGFSPSIMSGLLCYKEIMPNK